MEDNINNNGRQETKEVKKPKIKINLTFAAVVSMILVVLISSLTAPKGKKTLRGELNEMPANRAEKLFDDRIDSLIAAEGGKSKVIYKSVMEEYNNDAPAVIENRLQANAALLEVLDPEKDKEKIDSVKMNIRRLLEKYDSNKTGMNEYIRLVRIADAEGYVKNIRQHVFEDMSGYWDKVVYDQKNADAKRDSAIAESIRKMREYVEEQK